MLSCSTYILRDSGFCFSKLQSTLEMSTALNFQVNLSGELQMISVHCFFSDDHLEEIQKATGNMGHIFV